MGIAHIVAVTGFLAIGATAQFGCGGYLNALRSPMKVKDVPGSALSGEIDPERFTVEAKSSERSHISGRNNLTLQATISKASKTEVEILTLLASTEPGNVDPNNFYVHFNGGGQRVQVHTVSLGEVSQRPYGYSVQVPIRVEAGRIRFDDGAEARIYETKMVSQRRTEQYFIRSVRLLFRGTDLLPDNPERLVLELRDLGVDMKVVWNITGEVSQGGVSGESERSWP